MNGTVLFLLTLFLSGALSSPLNLRSLSQHNLRRFPSGTFFNQGLAFMCVSTPQQVRRVFENHITQLNICSISGLKAERTPQTRLYFGPDVIEGEKAVDEVFDNFCKPRSQGGLKGLIFKEEKAFVIGNVIFVQWIADAPFLKTPYPGSDAFATCGNKILGFVTTFDRQELVFKE